MIESRSAAALSASTSLVFRGPTESTHSVWHVFTEIGTQVMTLGAMEAALQRGDVSLSTLVWIPGMTEWEPLGEVANVRSPSLAAPVPARVSGLQLGECRGGGERARSGCNRARSAQPSLARASQKTVLLPAMKGARLTRKRGSLKVDALRSWRRAATLLTVLVLTLLGGWRLAQAVAPQHQRFTAPVSTAPAEAM